MFLAAYVPPPELLWAALGVPLGAFAAGSALDWAAFAASGERRAHRRGLVGAGICLGTGIWLAHALGAAASLASQGELPTPWLEAAIWLLAVFASAGALGWAGVQRVGAVRVLLAASGLGLATVSLLMLGLLSSAGTIELAWRAGPLLAAAATGIVACAAVLGQHHLLRGRAPRLVVGARAAVAVGFGVALAAAQHLVLSAAQGADAVLPAEDRSLLLPWVLVGVTLVAAVALLVLMRAFKGWCERAEVAHTLARRELAAQALNDPLTGLPNRPLFEGTLSQAVKLADALKRRLALLLINLDGFQPINQATGYRGGDQVLREVAHRLRALAEPHMAARLAGDEFLMLLTSDPRPEEASALAAEILAAVSRPILIDGRETTLSCSIGIAMYPEHGAMSALFGHAEAAMRTAKAAGGASHAFFEARMINGSRDQAELLRDLRLALQRHELELYYQPKIHAPSGEITGAEALMRWRHPQRGMVSPAVFIPIAERYGLIAALGQWMIDESCRQVRTWRDAGLRMRVAINLSAHQLRQPELAERIGAALRQQQINPDLITCEITESAAMEDTEVTTRVLGELARVGVHISIDDFGTGHSSLAYLRKLPAQELKIDRSFVMDLETSEEARKVASAVINLAKALELKVVAEGVETEGQNRILREFGCDQLQGFLFARPMSPKALALWAMDDVGPRTLSFRESLFRGPQTAQLA